jgi:hypothetical protein
VLGSLGLMLAIVPALHVPDPDSTSVPPPAVPPRVVESVPSAGPTRNAARIGPTGSATIADPIALSVPSFGLGAAAGLGPLIGPAGDESFAADTAPPHKRPKAVEYSDFYYTRLTIHRIGSYTMLPLFFGEYLLGQKLISTPRPAPSGLKTAHGVVAGAIAVVFGVNTITGGWNWWEARHDTTGRTRRNLHTILMLVAEAGFVATAASAPGGGKNNVSTTYGSSAQLHRAIAIGSITLATASTVMMWLWKN